MGTRFGGHAVSPAPAVPSAGTDASRCAVGTLTLTVGELAHELANMVDASSRFLRLALSAMDSAGTPATGDACTHLARAGEALDRAASMLASALGHDARAGGAGAGGAILNGSATLADAVNAAVAHARPLADEMGVRLVIDLDPRAGRAPATVLFSVVSNALRNSLNAMRGVEGGTVTIRARADHGTLHMTITDTGPGPGDEALARAFDHGYSTTGGAGIGLALSRRLVESVGGEMTLARGQARRNAPPGAVLDVRVPMPEGSIGAWMLNDWGE